MKSAKVKMLSFSVAFLILNIAITLFAYTFSISQMKNTLAKAAEKSMKAGTSSLENTLNSGVGNIMPMPDISGMDFGLTGQFDSGFFGMQGGAEYNPDDFTIPNDFTMPNTDESGNYYIDSDGDGEYDTIITEDGNQLTIDSMTRTDEEGNTYFDFDGDALFEVMMDTNGEMHYDLDGDGKYETNYSEEWGDGG